MNPLGILLLELLNLVLVFEQSILMLLSQHIHRILALQLRFLEEFAQLLQFSLTLAVRLDLKTMNP
jgi:hypothetical protein